jgi:hypothetical protein
MLFIVCNLIIIAIVCIYFTKTNIFKKLYEVTLCLLSLLLLALRHFVEDRNSAQQNVETQIVIVKM